MHHQEDEDGNKSSQQGSSPDGNDLASERVSVLRPDNLAIGKGNGERSSGGGLCEVDTKTDSTHTGHGDDVKPCSLEPLSESRASRHGERVVNRLLVVTGLCTRRSPVRGLFSTEERHVGDLVMLDNDVEGEADH